MSERIFPKIILTNPHQRQVSGGRGRMRQSGESVFSIEEPGSAILAPPRHHMPGEEFLGTPRSLQSSYIVGIGAGATADVVPRAKLPKRFAKTRFAQKPVHAAPIPQTMPPTSPAMMTATSQINTAIT